MPSNRVGQTLYIGAVPGPEQLNVATLYKPGELGARMELTGKAYQLVQVDSGATASTGAGHVPQCGDLAFWKDRKNYLVTNDKVQADVGDNALAVGNCLSVAGVFCSLKTSSQAGGDTSITPGNYGFIQQRGIHVGVLNTSGGAIKGDALAATITSTSATPTTTKFSPGTVPTTTVVGIATAATSAVTTNYTPIRLAGFDLVDTP